MRTREDIAQGARDLADHVSCLGGDDAPTGYELRDALFDLCKLVAALATVDEARKPGRKRKK